MMTNKQRLNAVRRARRRLQRTNIGYLEFQETGAGSEWTGAMEILEELERDLKKAIQPAIVVPDWGPIWKGGKPLLEQDLTHITSNLGWPALDDGWVAGRPILAPEDVVVYDNTSSSQGGDAFYVRGESGAEFWVAHITTVPAEGKRFSKGQIMTRISADHPRPHVHLAINARPLIGRHLVSHDDYTHGAPLIGVQLRKALERR